MDNIHHDALRMNHESAVADAMMRTGDRVTPLYMIHNRLQHHQSCSTEHDTWVVASIWIINDAIPQGRTMTCLVRMCGQCDGIVESVNLTDQITA